MSEIIGVRFKEGGKIYYFRPNEEELAIGSHVVVETVRGVECGEVVMDRREIDDSEFTREVKTIIRKANDADLVKLKENKIKARKAFDICNQKIKAHGLEMNLLEVECTFDNSKMVFNFSAEGRVDFRELVKDLASVFHARIELRQIGVRDEAKMLGGLGVCGRPFCCKQFMGDFQSVSIKMAKEQGLSLNPVKISGTCGRLMCCLKHEQDAYEDLMRTLPQVGSQVMTPEGPGVVVDRELIAGRVKVRLDSLSEAPPKIFRAADVYKPGEAPAPSASSPSTEKRASSQPARSRKKPAPEPAENAGRTKNMPEFTESFGRKKPAPDPADATGEKKKPVFDYKAMDFEESISGRATKINPEEYEEAYQPERGGNRNSSRRGRRRPDRRNQGPKESNGSNGNNRNNGNNANGVEKPPQKETPSGADKGGNPAGSHSRRRAAQYKKKNSGKPGAEQSGGQGEKSDV